MVEMSPVLDLNLGNAARNMGGAETLPSIAGRGARLGLGSVLVRIRRRQVW